MTALKRPKSLTELVTEDIRSRIINGQIHMGESLSEVGISRELDVSRTPVREAINRLESEGLVRTEPNRGTTVFRLEPEELVKICDVRVCLETTAMRAAFEHNREQVTERLERCLEDMHRHRDDAQDTKYLMDDTVFHQILFDCADNRFLSDAYHTISAMMAALRMQLGRHADHMEKSYQEHIRIVEMLERGDLERALDILEKHIGRKEGSYWTDITTESTA